MVFRRLMGWRFLAGGLMVGWVVAAGATTVPPFVVNSHWPGDQSLPAVAATGSEDFVVVWQSDGQDGDGLGVFGQLFDRDGAPVGGEFRANASPFANQASPAVASTGDGFVVVWEEYDLLEVRDRLQARLFDVAGMPLGSEFRVDAATRPTIWRRP